MKHLSRLFRGLCYVSTILLAILIMIAILIIISKYIVVGVSVMFVLFIYLVGWDLEVTFKKDDK